jgi:hypothetical protein
MRRVAAALLVAAVAVVGCRSGGADPTGEWSLYVPPDMVAQAAKSGEIPPKGTLEVLRNGRFRMNVRQASGRVLEAEGRWTLAEGSFTAEGSERTIGPDGRSSERSFRSTGAFSPDGRRLRVYGRDFVR